MNELTVLVSFFCTHESYTPDGKMNKIKESDTKDEKSDGKYMIRAPRDPTRAQLIRDLFFGRTVRCILGAPGGHDFNKRPSNSV